VGGHCFSSLGAASAPALGCAAKKCTTEYTGGVFSPLLRARDPAGVDPSEFGVGYAVGSNGPTGAVTRQQHQGVILMKSKYYVRVMRPTFQRAILTVEARSEEAAVHAALGKAEQLSEADWARLEADREPPVVEIVLSEKEPEGDSDADVLEYVRDGRYAYALLQADVDEAGGTFIAPMWLKDLPELAAADITQDWSEAVSGVSGEESDAFYAWLTGQGRPSNVVDFLSERAKRRGTPADDPDAEH